MNINSVLQENLEVCHNSGLGYSCMHVGALSKCYQSSFFCSPKTCLVQAKAPRQAVYVHSFLPDLKEKSHLFLCTQLIRDEQEAFLDQNHDYKGQKSCDHFTFNADFLKFQSAERSKLRADFRCSSGPSSEQNISFGSK